MAATIPSSGLYASAFLTAAEGRVGDGGASDLLLEACLGGGSEASEGHHQAPSRLPCNAGPRRRAGDPPHPGAQAHLGLY
ncbi:hypothetical protein BHM03_00010876 [Ensete ventricosum]|nr:hypothetical protein BHM03_00010876 [Ensete ventricosum]